MRISDWSSDVCSSDLPRRLVLPIAGGMTDAGWAITLQEMMRGTRDLGILLGTIIMQWPIWVGGTAIGALIGRSGMEPKHWGSSEERRVGQECDSTRRSRW